MNRKRVILLASMLMCAVPAVALQILYTAEGDTTNATDRLIGDGVQNGVFTRSDTNNIRSTTTDVFVDRRAWFGREAFGFNKTSDYLNTIDIPSSSTLGSAFTLAAFVRPVASKQVRRIFSTYHSASPNNAQIIFDYGHAAINGLRLYVNAKAVTATSLVSIPANEYTHLAATYDNGAVKLYCNGTEVGSGTAGSGTPVIDYNEGRRIQVGEDWSWGKYGPKEQSAGHMDDILVYDRALSANEIEQVARFGATCFFSGTLLPRSHSQINDGSGATNATVQWMWGAPAQQKRAEILWTKVLCKQPDRYIGWPSVCLRKRGELLAVFSGDREGHVCPWGKVQLIRSKDFGETWSPAVTIYNTLLDDRDAGILEMPNGDLLMTWFTSLAYQRYFRNPENFKPGTRNFYWWMHDKKIPAIVKKESFGFFTVRSVDDGETWEAPVRTPGSAPHGPILLKDGRLLYVGTTYRSGLPFEVSFELSVAESRDQGRSWQRIGAIPPIPEDEYQRCCEPHVVETDDGRLVAQIRFHAKPETGKKGFDESKSCLRQSESTDGGKTWTGMTPTPLQGYPPHLIKLRDGTLLSVYGRRMGPAFGEYACLSRDHGRTWDVANEIKLAGHFNGDLGYPASVELPDGSILTVYYQADLKGEQSCLIGTKWRMKD